MARVGRPTKYEDKFVDQVEEYIQTTGREQTTLPTVEGYARYIGVNTDTIAEWCKTHPEFTDAIKELKEKQKEQLMTDGMYGGKEVNSAMAIFLLKANHNMIETERKEITGKDGKDLPQPILLNVSSDNSHKEDTGTHQEN